MANLGIKINVDYSSIDDLAKKINQLTKDDLEIDLKLHTSKATEKLTSFKSKYDELKTYMKDGLDLKFDSNGNFDKAFQNMKSNADKVSGAILDVQKQASEMNEKFKGSDGSLSTMARTVKNLANGTKQTTDTMTKDLSSYEKAVTTVINNEQKSVKTTTDKKAALKEIAGVMSEIGTLNTKSLSADDRSGAAIKDRVATLKSQLSSLQSYYKTVFNEDSNNSSIVKQTSALNAYNQEIKQASIEKQKQAQFDKETEGVLKQIVQLSNEKYRLLKQSDNAGENEASVLRKQADAVQDKSTQLIKQQGLLERITVAQAQSLNNLEKENNVAREYSATLAKAKSDDSAKSQAQANAYREIKSQMQDVYAIQEKITQLTALEKNGTLTGKEEARLQSLRQELSVRQDIMTATKNQYNAEGNLTTSQKDSLSSLQKEKSYKLESARATAEINAKARQTDQLYNEIASSMKKVHTLSNDLANAGDSESRVIRDIIGLEEKRQSAIRETLALQGRINNSREDELNTMRKQDNELQEQNSRRSKANQLDNMGGNGILGNFLNPMSIANDVRQAAMTMYDSIAPLDEAMVNIAKVAEEPQSQLDDFAKTIYSTASTVGKSAEEYAVSVERWLTAGHTLNESVALSKTSVMGAFVGNIGEAEMVDFMSVPLNAYKKSGLEATDVINAMNEVANTNAIEMDDMGAAYKRAASTSAQAGTSFAQLTGLITAGQEATRVGGETMGTAIKAMDVNLGKIGSRITKGDAARFDYLKNLGVNVKDANGEMRSTFEVLGDLNKVWDKLNSDQKSTSGFYLAGKQFQNIFSGIMGNWDVVTKATNQAQGQINLMDKESGSAFQEFEKQQSSIAFKAANLKNAWSEFLNTVAGGKDNVKSVMSSLTDGLKLATQLANNDGIRKVASAFGVIVASLTGYTVIKSFFDIITKGARESMASLTKMAGSAALAKKSVAGIGETSPKFSFKKTSKPKIDTSGIGETKRKYVLNRGNKPKIDVSDVTSELGRLDNSFNNTAKVGTSAFSKISSVGKTTLGKTAGLITGVIGAGMKVVPVIGGVLTAIEVLEAFGVPVWGTLGKMVDKFTGKTYSAKKELKAFQKEQDTFSKAIQGNKILDGSIKEATNASKGWVQTINEIKEKAPDGIYRFNKDQFEAFKQDFNAQAEKMGLDLKITVNNWDEIEQKVNEFNEQTAQKQKDQAINLSKNIIGKSKPQDVKNMFKDYDETVGKIVKKNKSLKDMFTSTNQDKLKIAEKRIEDNERGLNSPIGKIKWFQKKFKEAITDAREDISKLTRYDVFNGDLFGGSDMKKMDSQSKKQIEQIEAIQKQFVEASKTGVLKDNVNNFDQDGRKNTIAMLSKEVPALESKRKKIDEIRKVIAGDERKLTSEETDFIENKLKLSLKDLGSDTRAWDRDSVEASANVINGLKAASEEAGNTQANIEDTMVAFGKANGMNDQEIQHLIDTSRKGGLEYIKMMGKFGDVGAAMLGVTAKVRAAAERFGTTWQTIVENAQQSIDVIKGMDGGEAKLLRFKIIKEDGNINVDTLDEVYSFPDSVQKVLKFVNEETGQVSVANVVSYLEKVNSAPREVKIGIGLKDGADLSIEQLGAIFNLPESTLKKLDIVNTETGDLKLENLKKILDELSQDKKLKLGFKVDGTQTLDDTLKIFNNLTEEQIKEILVDVYGDGEAKKKLDEVEKEAQKIDEKKAKIKVGADTDEVRAAEKEAEGIVEVLNSKEAISRFLGNNEDLVNKAGESTQKVNDFNNQDATARLNAENQEALAKVLEAQGFLVTFDTISGTATITADPSKFNDETSKVDAALALIKDGKVKFTANTAEVDSATVEVEKKAVDRTSQLRYNALIKGDWDDVQRAYSLGNVVKTITYNVVKNDPSKISKSGDQSIGIETGSSFSASVGSQIGTSQSSSIDSATSKYSRDNEKPATVNEDVWRYWSKELFEGMPLQNSLDKLKDSIDAAGDNQDKLISLYRQQIAQYDRQIAYQRGLGGAYQDEMNSVLGKLRGKGFNANGNQITNLGHAQSLSGENASESETLLNKWKELYSSINETQKTINDLNASKRQAEEQIKDADTARELKKIEGILKRTEAILKSVENNTSIQSVKEGFLGAGDYELSLNVKEQGLNSSINSVNSLIDEYNKLATTSITYAENAEKVQSTLDSLKSTILSNADSIIQYRETLNSIRIDRLVTDYEKYSQVINDSIERIGNSIDNLKEGLVSGTTLSDLYSSQLGTLDLTRKTKLEQEHENRLNLEAELDAALDGFAKKNVERTQNVSNQILTIEKAKYQNLLRLAQDYTNGTPLTITTATVDNIGIGLTGATNKDKTQYNSWTENLKKITQGYNNAYANMVAKYDTAIKKAKNGSEKEILTNQMVIDQLKLQEAMYKQMITTNNQMITQSKVELENLTLTTEQRQKLQDAIKEYQQSNIDAQKSIKESISARFEFEFDLIDKALDKASKYSENLSYLLNISELINMSSGSKQSLYEAIFAGKINEYSKAKKNLESLVSEQKKFEEGSYEWNLLKTKIDDVRGSLHDLTADALNANKDLLENNLSIAQESLEKGLLGGKTLEDWKDYQENWVTGISKEIELEAIRKRMVGLEDEVINKRLEALDRQEAVSKKDIEYLDKQSKILELQTKLNNISKERSVQTLVRGDDGKWAWQYVADQTEYDNTKKELNDAKKELDEFKNSQRAGYVEGLGGIIDKAKDGKYSSPEELTKALADLNSVYGNILTDIPNLNFGSIDEVVSAYQKYLVANKLIAGDAIGAGTALTQQTISNIGLQFESSFMNIADKLGEIIGSELRNALGMLNGKQSISNGGYIIQNQELQFPNVTDANGIEEVFKNLPTITEQLTLKK